MRCTRWGLHSAHAFLIASLKYCVNFAAEPKALAANERFLATALGNSAKADFQNGDKGLAAEEVREGVDISREIWKANPAKADDLATMLLLDSMIEWDPIMKCRSAQGAAYVAQSDRLRKYAAELLAPCKP
jgi:hypothetical protein